MAFGAGTTAPTAAADSVDIDNQVVTSGPLFALLAQLGLDSLGPISQSFAGFNVNLTLTLNNVKAEAADLSNANNSIAKWGNTFPLLANPGTRNIIDLVSGTATPDLIEAYRGMIQGISTNNGNVASWPTGFTPWTPGAGTGNPDDGSACDDNDVCRADTWQTLGLVRDLYRPNGGLLTRFAGLANLFGIDTTLPDTGLVANGTTGDPATNTSTERLYTSILDLTWEYDPLADFPVTLNPFSLLNTVMATLPLNILTGISNLSAAEKGIIGAAVPTILGSDFAGLLPTGTFYSTLQTNGLPIMELLRLPVQLINLATGWKLPTPIANILEPMMKILVNTGYSDVLTPDELNNCAQACGTGNAKTWTQLGYSAYDRALTQGGQTAVLNGSEADVTPAWTDPSIQGQSQDTVRFLSEQPLTFEEWMAVPGDLVNAFFVGLNQAFNPPQPIIPAGALASSAATAAAATAAVAPRLAAARVASPAAAVDTADESTPAEPATLSVSDTANDSAPVAATPKPRPTAAHSGAREAGAKAGSAHGGAVSAAAAKPRAGARG